MIIQARDGLNNLVSRDIRTVITQEIRGAEIKHGKGEFVLIIPAWMYDTLQVIQSQMRVDGHLEGEGVLLFGNPVERGESPEITYRGKES